MVGAFDPSATKEGFRGGAKLNYHTDFQTPAVSGYVHGAVGAYHDFFDASDTGARTVANRARTEQTIFGAQVDAAIAGKANIAGDHLRLRYAADADALLAVPLTTGAGDTDFGVAKAQQYSGMAVGVSAGVSGTEHLGGNWNADWALEYRQRADLAAIGTNISMSGGDHLNEALLKDAGTASVAAAVSYQGTDGSRLRVEAGDTRVAASNYGVPFSSGQHYLSVGGATRNDRVSGAVLMRGRDDGGVVTPVSSIGAAVAVKPTDRLTIGLGAELQLSGPQATSPSGPSYNVMGTVGSSSRGRSAPLSLGVPAARVTPSPCLAPTRPAARGSCPASGTCGAHPRRDLRASGASALARYARR